MLPNVIALLVPPTASMCEDSVEKVRAQGVEVKNGRTGSREEGEAQ